MKVIEFPIRVMTEPVAGEKGLWSTYHIGMFIGYGTWPRFCSSFGPEGPHGAVK